MISNALDQNCTDKSDWQSQLLCSYWMLHRFLNPCTDKALLGLYENTKQPPSDTALLLLLPATLR